MKLILWRLIISRFIICLINTENSDLSQRGWITKRLLSLIYQPKKIIPTPQIAIDNPEIGVMYFSNHSVLIKLNP